MASRTQPNAAVLWTGGKDSYLSLLAARDRLRITRLVTFAPHPPRPFLAHPLALMTAQARSLGIEHVIARVEGPPAEAYERAIDSLADQGIEVLVTGDMDQVAGHDNWIEARARGRARVERPLWKADRAAVLRSLLDYGIEAVCTLARKDSFEETIAGRRLDAALVDELLARNGHEGFDACGENGEYHTCVLDGPGFAQRLQLLGIEAAETDGFHHITVDAVVPTDRSPNARSQ